MQKSSSQIGSDKPGTLVVNKLLRAIAAGFLSVMLLVAFSFSFSYQTLSSIENLVSEIVDTNNKKMELIHQLTHIARERLILLHQMSNESDVFVRDDSLQAYYALGEQFILSKEALEAEANTIQELQIMRQLKSILIELNPMQARILETLSNGENKLAAPILLEFDKQQNELGNVLNQYSGLEQKFRFNSSVEIKNIFESSLYWLVVLSLFIIFIGVLVSFLVVRFVMKQQKQLIDLNDTLESYNEVLKTSTLKAERANRSKSDFIANMSHELRTPMTAIKGSLGILDSGMIENIPGEAKDLISMADKNTDRLIDLVTDVLDFSKLEADEIDIVKEEFLIHSEIDKFLIPFYKKARNKSIDFKVSLSTSLPMTVKLDRIHLFQILTQLISNAIKFTPEGEVSLKVEYKEEDDNIVFHIIDTGIGLDEEDVHFLFESFVQGDASSTRKFGGTGIGLAICRKLIDALDGDIKVSSKKDEGSVFSLYVPVTIDDIAA